jgi:hypothetical protein
MIDTLFDDRVHATGEQLGDRPGFKADRIGKFVHERGVDEGSKAAIVIVPLRRTDDLRNGRLRLFLVTE